MHNGREWNCAFLFRVVLLSDGFVVNILINCNFNYVKGGSIEAPYQDNVYLVHSNDMARLCLKKLKINYFKNKVQNINSIQNKCNCKR